MRAAVYTQYGPPDVVQLNEVAKPVPNQNEVLIKVVAATVNRTDCGFRSAQYFVSRLFSGLLKPKHQILGCEVAGVIEQTGSGVKGFIVGDKVFGYNDKRFGAHADYMLMDENDSVAIMPAGLSFEDASPIAEGAHYALCDLRAAKIKKGDAILINGGTGAIGSAALQLSAYFGATVTAVCQEQHCSLVQSLGAAHVVPYNQQDFTQLGGKFDVVFDAVGKSSFNKCKPILKEKGIYISTELGKRSENVFLALLSPFLRGKKVLFPIPSISKDDVLFLKDLVERGRFKPVIDRKYPLENIREAYRYVETGHKIGNVVITI